MVATDAEDPVVLVVDDEPQVADSYAAVAGDHYEVRTAYGGEEALSKLDDEVDVVLLDRRMPDRRGDDVLAAIRERGVDCRVAMITAVDPDVDVVDMAFDDYVVKPVTPDDLLTTVDRLLRVGEYDRTLREYYRATRKHVALTSALDETTLADDPTFEELSERRDRLRAKFEATTDRLEDDDFAALFREFDAEFGAADE